MPAVRRTRDQSRSPTTSATSSTRSGPSGVDCAMDSGTRPTAGASVSEAGIPPSSERPMFRKKEASMSSQRMCEGRVCIVTGAGRGLGREYALSLAQHGATVVVNDLGGERDGTGADTGPAQEVVDEITEAGGEAAANSDDVSSWDGAASLVQQAVDTFGSLDVLVNNAGILRDR